jgi:hypothetical protein
MCRMHAFAEDADSNYSTINCAVHAVRCLHTHADEHVSSISPLNSPACAIGCMTGRGSWRCLGWVDGEDMTAQLLLPKAAPFQLQYFGLRPRNLWLGVKSCCCWYC